MDSGNVIVFLYKGKKSFEVPLTDNLTAEDVCISVCKFLRFRPTALHLVGLRLSTSGNWLPTCYRFETRQNYSVEFRIRYKLPAVTELIRLDEAAFDYLYHQTRHELLAEKIPELVKDHRSQVLGLCVTDMLRAIEEENCTLKDVETNLKKYIPGGVYKKFFLVIKKKAMDSLTAVQQLGKKRGVKFLKEQYLSRVEDLAPSYMTEKFQAFKGSEFPATVKLDAYNSLMPGLSLTYIGKENWEHICSISDLCFVTTRDDNTAEISRKNGIPITLKFKTVEEVQSFVSSLDGYYRLCEKWTFNLCRELPTPSLLKLRSFKCHGPVGEQFAYRKLATHPSSGPGTYIIRQSSSTWGHFMIDYIIRDKNNPLTKEIIQSPSGKYSFAETSQEFATVPEMISYHVNNPQDSLKLVECLQPSEYDFSSLLMGRKQDFAEIGNVTHVERSTVSISGPQCISGSSFQVFRGKKYEFEGKTCKVLKAEWKLSKSQKVTVAIKRLKEEYEDKLMKELLEIADKCVAWQSDSLLQLRGVVLGNPKALVFDWMPLGSLDTYLQSHSTFVEPIELIEAASQVAKAVWFLEDNGIIHGNIRCHNVLVQEHNKKDFIVRLADPSIPQYTLHDLHWIPPELYDCMDVAKVEMTADIWALGTTLWEIFSCGRSPPADISLRDYRQQYSNGWRLLRPEKCPPELYRIISECWSSNPDGRKRPQATVRDIHQILYQLIGSKRVHAYATISSSSMSSQSSSQANSKFDLSDCNWASFGEAADNHLSGGTVSTFLNGSSIRSDSSNVTSRTEITWLAGDGVNAISPDLISGFSNMYNGSIRTIYSTGSAQGIYEFGKDQVTLGRPIGEGCYGVVHMAEVRRSDGFIEQVAVKVMKDSVSEEQTEEFQREIEILKELNHPNIVEVKGIVSDPSFLLIMEYVPMGSLKSYFRMAYTKPSMRQLLKFAQDICEGMEYLASHNIVHRDLAARNILVANDDLVKISDFGLARFTDNDTNCYKLQTDRKLPVQWYPPESLQQCKFSEKSDVWSFGVTLFEIFSYGEHPKLPGVNERPESSTTGDAEQLNETLQLLSQGVRLQRPEHCPDVVYTQLMLPCWDLNPDTRPTFTKLFGDIQNVEYHLLHSTM